MTVDALLNSPFISIQKANMLINRLKLIRAEDFFHALLKSNNEQTLAIIRMLRNVLK